MPLDVLVDKFSHTRYEPSGFTRNKEIPIAKSITDYLFRWMALRFNHDDVPHAAPSNLSHGSAAMERPRTEAAAVRAQERQVYTSQADAPSCASCGAIMIRSGSCYKCANCGSTSGCSLMTARVPRARTRRLHPSTHGEVHLRTR